MRMPTADDRKHDMDWRERPQCWIPQQTAQGTHLHWVTFALYYFWGWLVVFVVVVVVAVL